MCLERSEASVAARAAGSCALPAVGAGKLNSAPLQEHYTFLATEPSLQYFYILFFVYILGQPGENRVTLVFFLGGVTFAEIAALRFLSQLEDGGTEYVIATTKLMNGNSWIEALMEKPF